MTCLVLAALEMSVVLMEMGKDILIDLVAETLCGGCFSDGVEQWVTTSVATELTFLVFGTMQTLEPVGITY